MFRQGTWRWAATTSAGRVCCRERGMTVAEANAEGLVSFDLLPVVPIGRLTLSRSGQVAGRDVGVTMQRQLISIRPGFNVSGLVFTRRTIMAGDRAGEEILVRYTWMPTGERVLVHVRSGQVLVDLEYLVRATPLVD